MYTIGLIIITVAFFFFVGMQVFFSFQELSEVHEVRMWKRGNFSEDVSICASRATDRLTRQAAIVVDMVMGMHNDLTLWFIALMYWDFQSTCLILCSLSSRTETIVKALQWILTWRIPFQITTLFYTQFLCFIGLIVHPALLPFNFHFV